MTPNNEIEPTETASDPDTHLKPWAWVMLVCGIAGIFLASRSVVVVSGPAAMLWGAVVLLFGWTPRWQSFPIWRLSQFAFKTQLGGIVFLAVWAGLFLIIGYFIPHGRIQNIVLGLGFPPLLFAAVAGPYFLWSWIKGRA